MAKSTSGRKGYNEKNPANLQGSFTPDNTDEQPGYPAKSTKNEKLSIPERKLKNRKLKQSE